MFLTYGLYNFILIASTVFIYYSEKCRLSEDRRLLVFVAFVIVTLPAAVRYNIAYDYSSYVQIYNELGSSGNVEGFWVFFISVLNNFKLSSDSFFIFSSILIYGVFYFSLPKKYGYIINFIYILFFYFQSYSLIRSFLVTSYIFIICFSYMREPKIISHLVVLLVMSIFVHKSAIVFLALFLISIFIPINFWLRLRWISLILAVLLFIYRYEFIEFITNLPLLSWIGYDGYMLDPHFLTKVELGTGIGFLCKLLILFSPLFITQSLLLNNQKYSFCVVLLLFGVVSLILSVSYQIFDRLYLLSLIAYPIAVYLILLSSSKTWIVLPFLLFGVIFFELSITKQLSSECESLRISPYVSIFNKDADRSLPISMCQDLN